MEERTIPLHGGGELTIGGGPPIDGVLHGWVRKPEGRREGSFMLGAHEAHELALLLRARELGKVKTFTGSLIVCHGGELAILWFYPWGSTTPDLVARLYDGAIERLAEVLEEQCDEYRPEAPHLRSVA